MTRPINGQWGTGPFSPGQQPLLLPRTFTLVYYWNLSLCLEGWVCDRSERLKQGRKCSLIINGGEWDWGLQHWRAQDGAVLMCRRAML